MTPLVRRYIKTSFVFLLAGLVLGGWIIAAEFLTGRYPPRLFITAHVHLLLVGFMLMIVMGVATWMFPRPARDDAGYRPGLAEVVYWVMTSPPRSGQAPSSGPGSRPPPRSALPLPPAAWDSSPGPLLFVAEHVAPRPHASRRHAASVAPADRSPLHGL